MTADAQRLSRSPGPQAKRRWRNYLLVPSFQFKYTGMVVGVTVAVASVLGVQAYYYSKGQTELIVAQKLIGPEGEEFAKDIETYSQAEDRKVAASIVLGVLALALALGFTGIVVTHKLVGPAYRLKTMLRDVRDGRLRVQGRLRKGDELQDIFEAFHEMIESLRAAQEQEIALLNDAIDRAKAVGIPPEAIAEVEQVRDRMKAALD
jgi:methyl-accepting chemotaxis protein